MSRIDIVVFGASGFTGKCCVQEIVKLLKVKEPFTWGVAGRSKAKLEQVLAEVGEKFKIDLQNIPILIADVKDQNSLNVMAASSKIIINCCGPFMFYGEPVVRACIENKTHHVDVSGEPMFLEKIQLDFHKKAQKAGVYVVGSCGADSIFADMGVVFFKNEFKSDVNSIETYLEISVTGDNKDSPVFHYGTWETAIDVISKVDDRKLIRKSLYPNPLPIVGPELKERFLIHKNDLNKWSVPFLGGDKEVIERSQYYFYEEENQRPVQVNTYIALPNLLAVMMMTFVGATFLLFSKFSLGRKLLLDYPMFFSYGWASHEGPDEEGMKNTKCSMTFIGRGWEEKLPEPTDKHRTNPDKRLVTKISANDPAYGGTSIMLLISALTILRESDKLPAKGGVYPPGAAFAKTTMIEQLNELGIKFEVVSRE